MWFLTYPQITQGLLTLLAALVASGTAFAISSRIYKQQKRVDDANSLRRERRETYVKFAEACSAYTAALNQVSRPGSNLGDALDALDAALHQTVAPYNRMYMFATPAAFSKATYLHHKLRVTHSSIYKYSGELEGQRDPHIKLRNYALKLLKDVGPYESEFYSAVRAEHSLAALKFDPYPQLTPKLAKEKQGRVFSPLPDDHT